MGPRTPLLIQIPAAAGDTGALPPRQGKGCQSLAPTTPSRREREQKRHFSPSGLSNLYRRAFLVGDRGVLHAAPSDFDQSAQQNEFLIKGRPVKRACDSSHSSQRDG